MSKRGEGSDEPVDDELPEYWHKSRPSPRIVGFGGNPGPSGSSGKPGPSGVGGKSSSRKEPDLRGLNILCLDGGGVRGLSELVLLSEVMNRLGAKYGIPTPQPAGLFDIIAGSGTGGVIACMLGRLMMPIDVAILEYGKLVQKGFSERKSVGSTGGAYVGSNLQKALKAMIKEATGNEDERMRVEDESGCKTMVFAMSKHNMNSSIPVLFRSYLASANSGPDCTIWEALYATMAHPDLFDSIAIGDGPLRQPYIGGDIGNSNPIARVLSEIRSLYLGRYVSCVLSVGAGHPRTIHIPDSPKFQLFRTKELAVMKHMATDSEREAEEMARRFEDVKGVYFRLSVDQGMQHVDSDDWEKWDVVAAHTDAYLKKSDVSRAMSLVVQVIVNSEATIAVAWIDGRIQALAKPIGLKHCPAPIPVFTGRDDEIEGAGLCVAGDVDERRVCVLYGLGGAGKSQLAFKVVEKNRDYWARIIYVNASSKDAIEDALRSLAVAKGVGSSHTAALGWLGCVRERWLLVLDNVNLPSVSRCISEYFPHGNRGSILITTRLADLVLHARGPSSAIQVSSMTPEQALLLLSKIIGLRGRILPNNDIDAAMRLLEDFGHLALAIVHAGAYIGHHPHITILDYHRLFLNGRQRMLEQYSRLKLVKLDDYDKTVYTTWTLCYDLLERRASQQLLWLIAFLYPRGITPEIFRRSSPSMQSRHPVVPLSDLEQAADDYVKEYLDQFQNHEGHWDSVAFSDTISELASYSLIESDRTNLSYNIHILVQDWVRSVVLDQSNPPDIWLERATTLLSRSIDHEEIDDAESINFKSALEPHVNKILVERKGSIGVSHAIRFADVLKARGEWDREELLRIQVRNELGRILGSEHHRVLKNAEALVAVYRNQEKWTDAESLCSYVWETRKRVLGDTHIETITSVIDLIEILQKQGQLDKAWKLHGEVEGQFSRWLSDTRIEASDPEVNRRGRLAIRLLQVAQCLGHNQDALTYKLYIYELMANRLEGGQDYQPLDEHYRLQTETIYLKLHETVAALCMFLGLFDAAESWYERLLRAQKHRIGSGHKSVQQTMQNLATVYLMLSKWKQANEIQRRVFDTCKHSFEQSDRNTILMKVIPCVTLTHVILGEWRQALLFIQDVRATSIPYQGGTGSVLKADLKSMSFLMIGTLELVNLISTPRSE